MTQNIMSRCVINDQIGTKSVEFSGIMRDYSVKIIIMYVIPLLVRSSCSGYNFTAVYNARCVMLSRFLLTVRVSDFEYISRRLLTQ